jgi:hypothetical protein
MTWNDTATGKQLSLIEGILTDNGLYDGNWDRTWKRLEAARIDERNPGDGTPVTRREASAMIDYLTGQGYRRSYGRGPAQQAPAQQPSGQPAEVGVYRRDGKLYVVREFTPRPETERDHGVRTGTVRQQGKVRYARQIIELTAAQGDRLNEQGDRIRTEEARAPRMQFELTAADRLTVEEVEALSVKFSYCLVCGRHLRVAESVEAGIGPVCRKRQQGALAAA